MGGGLTVIACKVCKIPLRWVDLVPDKPHRGGRWEHDSGNAPHFPQPISQSRLRDAPKEKRR